MRAMNYNIQIFFQDAVGDYLKKLDPGGGWDFDTWKMENENQRKCIISMSVVIAETLRYLEKLLRDSEKDGALRIERGMEKSATNPGDNYMSYVVKMKLTGTRGNGCPYENDIICKQLPHDRGNIDLIRNREFFTNEAHVYKKIVPRIGLEFATPKCYDANADNIIMEDLCLRGYKMCERRELLDLQHCRATLKTLALLHARSLIFKLNNHDEFEALFEPLKEAAFPQDNNPSLGQTISYGVIAAIENLKSIEDPDDDVFRAIKFLEGEQARAYNVIQDLVLRRGDKYDVMTHGDTWNNNIFFKYHENGSIANVKFVDFQGVRHISPAIDFHYFVYSSARSSVIEENYDELVEIYQTALVREMNELKASENVIRDLNLDWFREELRKTSIYGLLTGLWLMNALLAERDEISDISAITPDLLAGRTKFVLTQQPIRDEKVHRTKCIVYHYCRTYRNWT